jgi:penicillin-binding protein 1A
MKKLKKIELILILLLLFLSIVLGTGMGILISQFEDTADISSLEHFQPEIPSKIYDRNGNLISEIFTVKRDPVTFEKLPKDLVNAIIAIEDDQFYSHRGINIRRVFGALIANIKTGSRGQGSSTITMQLARTLFLGREKTWTRKIKEAWLTLKIEKKYSKNEILTLYFNQIYFGHGAYGIEAASQFYFNKHVGDLTLAECAMLAGLPQLPNKLSPIKNPELARQRQERVLEAMLKNKMISQDDAYNSYQDFWINFRLQLRSPSQSVYLMTENKAPHFVEYVRQRLEQLYGTKKIYTDGLKVYTSLDLSQQELAEKYLKEGLERQNEIHKYTMRIVKENLDKKILDSLDMLSLMFDLQTLDIGAHKNEERVYTQLSENFFAPLDMLTLMFGADQINRIIESSYAIKKSSGDFQSVEGGMIAIEPKTGYITSMVGGSAFTEDNQLNRAVQIRRQTGSGFKPYVYTAAIDTKIFTPATVIVDSPVVFLDGEDQWIPDNYGGRYRGKVRLREALRRSINVITAKIVDRLGVDVVIKYATNILGITDPDEIGERFPRVYSISLGVVELSPYEQAKGFATFANKGKEVTPIAILYVLDRDGNLIDNFEAELRKEQMSRGEKQILSEQTNYVMLDMLRDVMRPGGTGYRAATENEFDRPAAGKTGTTQNWKDAWFTGFTPDLVTSVWVGFDRNSVSLGRGQAGGVVSAPIWAKFMRDALKDKPATWYPKPKGVYAVKVCAETGLLPTEDCERTITELFLEGTIPTEYHYKDEQSSDDDSFNIDIFNRKEPASNRFLERKERSNIFSDEDIEDDVPDFDFSLDESFMEDYDPAFDETAEPADETFFFNIEDELEDTPAERDTLDSGDLPVPQETTQPEEISETFGEGISSGNSTEDSAVDPGTADTGETFIDDPGTAETGETFVDDLGTGDTTEAEEENKTTAEDEEQ